MENHHLPVKITPPSSSVPSTSDEHVKITLSVPATPKPNFLTPPATEEERPKLKRNLFSQLGRFFGLATKAYSNDDSSTTGWL